MTKAPASKTTTVGVRLRPDELAALDRYAKAQEDLTTRAGIAADIIVWALTDAGYLKPSAATQPGIKG